MQHPNLIKNPGFLTSQSRLLSELLQEGIGGLGPETNWYVRLSCV